MALLRLASGSLQVAGLGLASAATAVADAVTDGRVPELRRAREDQERQLHAAARGVEADARVVGADLDRAAATTGASAGALARIAADPEQLLRLRELIDTYDLAGFVRHLRQGDRLPPSFFPAWVRRAGGYFPKLAQVLSVRADLIQDREVLAQFAACLEDMPLRPLAQVREHLAAQGWSADACTAVGEGLNAGTVAQVNTLLMPGGTPAVVKVTWPDVRRQMRTDFRLFAHAHRILRALNLDDEQAQRVAAIFAAVGKSEAAVMREFDLWEEARALRGAAVLCAPGGEWDRAYGVWLTETQTALAQLPPPLSLLATAFVAQAQATGARVRVPEPLGALSGEAVLAMSRAGGASLHGLLSGSGGEAGRQEAAGALIGVAVPFVGWLLLCKSTDALAHVDPHPGNFRWDAGARTLWVLDWGSHITLPAEQRQALCLLVLLLAEGGADDDTVADTARAFGVRGSNAQQVALLMRGMFNVRQDHAAQEALNTAAVDQCLEDVDDRVVPVVRCLATLGGLLKELQRHLRAEHGQAVPLSLAALWRPFAARGLAGGLGG